MGEVARVIGAQKRPPLGVLLAMEVRRARSSWGEGGCMVCLLCCSAG